MKPLFAILSFCILLSCKRKEPGCTDQYSITYESYSDHDASLCAYYSGVEMYKFEILSLTHEDHAGAWDNGTTPDDLDMDSTSVDIYFTIRAEDSVYICPLPEMNVDENNPSYVHHLDQPLAVSMETMRNRGDDKFYFDLFDWEISQPNPEFIGAFNFKAWSYGISSSQRFPTETVVENSGVRIKFFLRWF